MRKHAIRRLLLSCATVLAMGIGSASMASSYILATATTGGTFYPVGVALSTLIKVKLEPSQGISLSAISSAGSGENLKLLDQDEVQFGILQGLYGGWAWTGTGAVNKQYGNLRSVTMLWQNVEHFLVRSKYAKTGTIDDLRNLKDQPFSIGKRNSGTEGSGRAILNALDIEPEAMKLVYLGYGPSAEGMQNGNVDGANIPAGAPAAAVTSAYANMGDDIRVLDFTDEHIKQVNQEFELWTRYVIKADTYPGQDRDINTIAQPNILVVRADVSDEDVYQITKTMYENLAFLRNIHPATKAMALDKAIAGLPMPLHPGAVKFYEEQGIQVPERLIAH